MCQHLKRHRKSIWQNSTSFYDHTPQWKAGSFSFKIREETKTAPLTTPAQSSPEQSGEKNKWKASNQKGSKNTPVCRWQARVCSWHYRLHPTVRTADGMQECCGAQNRHAEIGRVSSASNEPPGKEMKETPLTITSNRITLMSHFNRGGERPVRWKPRHFDERNGRGTGKRKDAPRLWTGRTKVKMSILPKAIYGIQCNHDRISTGMFHRNRNINF